jgi:hypothetical protein
MTNVWVSGGGSRAERLAQRLREDGLTVTLADPAADPAPPEHVDYYLQMPVTVSLAGDTVVARAHSFLSGGLLSRYTLVERVLPVLTRGARVLLVSGNQASMTSLPDDRHSRLALLHVLAHATRAELVQRGDETADVEVVSGDRTDDELVHFLRHGGADASVQLVDQADLPTGKQYEDWRTEIMGMMNPAIA